MAESDLKFKSRPEARHGRRRMAMCLLSAAFSLLVSRPEQALATDARADPTSTAEQRRALAKAKYEEGVEAYQGAHYADAARLFQEADATSPSAALSYNIARAYEKLGDDAQALRWYRNYLRLNPRAANASEVEGYVRSLGLGLARKGIQQLTVLTSPAGATVAIDGVPLGVSPLTAELRPGRHGVLLSRRGFADFNGELVLPLATPMYFSVALQAVNSKSAAPGQANQESARRFGVLPYVTLGAAVGCLGASAIFEVSRRSAQSSAANEHVQLDYEQDIDTMNGRQVTARVLLGAGGVLAATGATLLVLNTRRPSESRMTVAGVPGGATVAVERQF